jgi:UDP-N-acetylmuramoylalanine--D-glutamate ligase
MINVTKFVKSLNGKPVAVFGLGISNLAAIEALIAAGAKVVAWDDSASRCEAAAALGADIADLNAVDMTRFACLVLAPGVPLTHNPHVIVQKAKDAGLEILCDIEILHRCGHGIQTIGITGTNGKSTTTALIGHILNECGVSAAVGGNIGTPALALDLPRGDQNAIVLELSSYQLDLCPTFAPDIAVLLNLSPDHIDRHGDMDGYIMAKKRIFRGAGEAVIGKDDEASAKLLTAIGGARNKHQISAIDEAVQNLDIPTLRGTHNHQNMAAAYKVARLMGLAHDDIIKAMQSFGGLAHRQFLVRVIGNVSFVNDSKATNADASSKALDSFDHIHWIIGGRAKDGGLKGLESYKDRIECAYIIGEAADDFAAWCRGNDVAYEMCGTMDKAVAKAHENTKAEMDKDITVLLSPACASFDQYQGFEARGDDFTAHVMALEGDAA